MENSYYNHANRAYFLCKSYLFVKFFVIFLFIANVTLANGNGTSELYEAFMTCSISSNKISFPIVHFCATSGVHVIDTL